MHNQATRVVVADDDALTQAILARAVRRAGFSPVLASDGEQALRHFDGPSPPRIAILSWLMPELDGVEVCRRIRRRAGPPVSVLLISEQDRQEHVLQGLDAGADDVIAKPFNPEEVVARLRACERLLALDRPHSSDVRTVIDEGLESSLGGEVIVRSGDVVGKVLLHGGGIVWVHLSSDPSGLQTMLFSEAGVAFDDVRSVFEECKRTGQNLFEMLVEWKLVDGDQLRELVRQLFARKLAAIAALPSPSVLFAPVSHPYKGSMRFSADELLPRPPEAKAGRYERRSSRPRWSELPPPGREAHLAALLEGMAADGAQSMAIFDQKTGQKLCSRGAEVDMDLLRMGARLCQLMPEADPLEDMLLTSSESYHLFRTVPTARHLLLYLSVAREKTSLAMARFQLAQIAAQIE